MSPDILDTALGGLAALVLLGALGWLLFGPEGEPHD